MMMMMMMMISAAMMVVINYLNNITQTLMILWYMS